MIFRFCVKILITLCFFIAYANALLAAVEDIKTMRAHINEGKRLQIQDAYARLPLYFMENKGQVDKEIKFYGSGRGRTIYFKQDRICFDFQKNNKKPYTSSIITIEPLGMKDNVDIVPVGLQEAKVNYLIGNDSNKWHTGVSIYESIIYNDMYHEIDVRFYGNNQELEYDIIVNPHADISKLKFKYDGVKNIDITRDGSLCVYISDNETLYHKKPIVYQEICGKRIYLDGCFKIISNNGQQCIYGFEVSSYDNNYPLIIDPVLCYSTYMGGRADDGGCDITVDAAGNAYITGYTDSSDFPVQNAQYSNLRGSTDAFVTKLNSDGTAIAYSTYLGGSAGERGIGIAVDAAGNVYVTGYTESIDFPTQNALYPNPRGSLDAFVTKLNSDGTAITYSTYLGGSAEERGVGIAVDVVGNVYVTGYTKSSDFPTQNALYPNLRGPSDTFVTKLNAGGTAMAYSTYLGGSAGDSGSGIAVDAAGNAYITGYTESSDFPTQNALYPNLRGPSDTFVTKLNAGGTAMAYSTYLGGSAGDSGSGIAIDAAGNAYITGCTGSRDFPTQNALDPNLGNVANPFVTKLNSDGSTIIYSTYLGSFGESCGSGIAVDVGGNAYITGTMDSTVLSRAFVAELNAGGTSIVYSTYLGGLGGNVGYGIAVDAVGNAYVTGFTKSNDFPTKNALYPSLMGAEDIFVSKIAAVPSQIAPAIAQAPMSGSPGAAFVQWGSGFTPNKTATLHFQKSDGSEYPTQTSFLDSNGCFEISYKAPADKPLGSYTWWAVDDTTGIVSNTISYVIEQRLEYLFFSAIASPQETKGIRISITAKYPDGSTNTGFNGEVSLSASVGRTFPSNVTLKGGNALLTVALDASGSGVQLYATGEGICGESLPFDVTGAEIDSASLSGVVKNVDESTEKGASVYLNTDTQTLSSQITDSDGRYQFSGIRPGAYTVYAEATDGRRSRRLPIVLSNNQNLPLDDLVVLGSDVNKNGVTPILLLPGIMGSSTGGGGPYPILPERAPTWNESWGGLGLHDPCDHPGWRNLIKALHDRNSDYKLGCTIFPIPYDWRMHIDEIVEKYLKPKIDEAKKIAGTNEVNIIAHSMGGLVARAYIQSEDYKNRNDVDKFAMVGTPNHGASIAYYIWEGGDPVMADTVAMVNGDIEANVFWMLHLYQQTMDLQYLSYYNDTFPPDFYLSSYRYCMNALVKKHIVSMRQLLPVYDFLCYKKSVHSINSSDCHNQWLIDLNNSKNIEVMGKEDNTDNKIKTKIFTGDKKNTITNIYVGPSASGRTLYPDGEPLSVHTQTSASGDGTVLESSAYLDEKVSFEEPENASHSSLIDSNKEKLVRFMTGSASLTAVAARDAARAESAASSSSKEFTLHVFGRAQPYLVDPVGRKLGFDPSTGLRADGIANSTLSTNGNGISIIIDDPVDGTYTIHLKDSYAEDYHLLFFYDDVAKSIQQDAWIYSHPSSVSFTFQLDSTSSNRLSIDREPSAPEGLRAIPVESNGVNKTRLCWTASVNSSVMGYNVYTKNEDEPLMALLTTTSASCIDTNHPWAGDASVKNRIYAVSGITEDGSEGFLSESTRNNDRDYDGLSDAEEASLKTNINNPDTDGDGLNDGEEYLHGTNPLVKDSDQDGMADVWEVYYGTDPLSNDAAEDLDGDGWTNLMEYLKGSDPSDAKSFPSWTMPWLILLLEKG